MLLTRDSKKDELTTTFLLLTFVVLSVWFSCLQARKLGGLLKEAERRREDLQGELGSQVLEVERSKADMEELLQHNTRLQQDSEEHQALKGAYNALLNRSEEKQIHTHLSRGVCESLNTRLQKC